MKKSIYLLLIAQVIIVCIASAQVENVAVGNPVYQFLKRMSIKRVIEKYHDNIQPVSRKKVAGWLKEIQGKRVELTETEREQLSDFLVEFQYDMYGTAENSYSIIDSNGVQLFEGEQFNDAEKHLYRYADSNVTLFVDGLLTLDSRRTEGDALGGSHAEFIQFGGRIRGTIGGSVGYYLQGTNAQFWGSRDLLRRDKYISQAYTLGIPDAQNFDFVEGYARYEGGIISAQLGRERLFWGNGYGDKLIISDNIRVFDFLRADAEYKSLKYTFLHGWLLGRKSYLLTGTGNEPVVADKYIGAHRLEISLPKITIGFQEMAIYSNRSVDLAYINPVTLIESAQRSREERDNILWAFDVQTRFFRNIEMQGTLLLDDLNFPKLGTSSYQNKFALQLGLMAIDPVGILNTTVAIEYTRVNPFTFSHERSRDNDYGSFYNILSHHIGPNADSWLFRFDYQPTHRLSTSLRFEIQREGENVYDSLGNLSGNVGGNYLVPHRESDPQQLEFLDGNRVKTYAVQALVTYEIINEIFFDVRYQCTNRKEFALSMNDTNHDFGIALRLDF